MEARAAVIGRGVQQLRLENPPKQSSNGLLKKTTVQPLVTALKSSVTIKTSPLGKLEKLRQLALEFQKAQEQLKTTSSERQRLITLRDEQRAELAKVRALLVDLDQKNADALRIVSDSAHMSAFEKFTKITALMEG